MLENKLKVN